MKKHTKMYPDLDPELIRAIESGTLIIFIGAGISALYGYPIWNELAKKLLNNCERDGKITKSQKAVLLSEAYDAMKQVTIACNKYDDEKGGVDKVVQILGKEPSKEEHKKINLIARYLAEYRCPIITTNADLSLDNSPAFKNGLILSSLKEWNHNCDDLCLIHLHGSITDPENMIFTSQAYASAYRVRNQEFGKKLLELLDVNKTILFIGYGLEEFELIKYFLSDISELPNRFILKGYLDKDELNKEFDEEYYRTLGIKLIPFSKEKLGYDALIKVLKKWNNTIKTETMAHRRIPQIISKICNSEPTSESIKKLEGLLNE